MTIEFSDYSGSFFDGTREAEITIFRDAGTYGWTLELDLDGRPIPVSTIFLADKAAYDFAIAQLASRGFEQEVFVADDYGLIESPLSRHINVKGHSFELAIYRGEDEPQWTVEIINSKGTSFIPEETFKSDQAALDHALADLANEPIEELLS